MPLSFGVLLLQDRPLDEVLGWARRFDAAGADSVWVADHLSNPHALDRPWLDPWLVLGAVAAETQRCRIGPLVSTFVVHSPLSLARKVHTLNVLSGNRLDLGVGAGGAPVDRAFTGVPDTSVTALVDRLDRGLGALSAALRGDRIDVPPVAEVAGRPVPHDVAVTFAEGHAAMPPLVVGGQSRATIDVAARYADRWNTFAPGRWGSDMTEAMRRASAHLDERCLAHGRDPASVTRSVLLDLTAETSAPTAEALADVVGRMADLGFEECIAYAWADGAVDRSPDQLLSFVADTLPALRASR